MKEFFAALVVTACLFSGAVMRYVPFRPVVEVHRKRLLWMLYGLITLANVVIATGVFHVWGIGKMASYLHTGASVFAIALTVVNAILIPGRLGEHVFAMGMTRTLHFLMLSIPAYLIHLLPEASPYVGLARFLLIYAVVVLLTHNPLQWLLRHTLEPYLALEKHQYGKTIFYIPLSFFVSVAILLWGSDSVDPLLRLISSVASAAMLILMCWSVGADCRRTENFYRMEHQLEAQRLHYAELKTRVEDARKLNHNLKHHIAAIRGFMDKDDKEGLDRYCEDLSIRFGETVSVPYTGNSAVDGVVYYYMDQARREQIDFKLNGTIRSPGIADIDLCAALGNALDNAITACRAVAGERQIALLCQSEKTLLTVVVRNTFDGVIEQNRGKILSRKERGRIGLGLGSMEAFCQRYGGSFSKSWDDKTFTVMFILPLSE